MTPSKSRDNVPVKSLERRLVYEGRVIGLVEEKIELPGGKVTTHSTVRHPGAVVILPVCENGDLLLLRQYRHSLRRSILELPAGTLNAGESPDDCARRELPEETGFAARTWQSLGTLFPAPGFCDELQYGYFASDLYPQMEQMDEDEFIEVERHTAAAVEKLVSAGELSDGKTLAFILKARVAGLI